MSSRSLKVIPDKATLPGFHSPCAYPPHYPFFFRLRFAVFPGGNLDLRTGTGWRGFAPNLKISGKEKTHKHNQICGIVPGLGGCQKVVYVFFLRVIPYGGEKTHKQPPPKKSRDNPVKILFTFGNPWPCYRGHLGLSGRKVQVEFENGFPGPLGLAAQKVQNGVGKESKSTIFPLF